jgi:NAD-reducing hydrogenase large subunit
MTRTVTIDPVTRIEGHAKITLRLGDDGLVEDARFHVTEFRGFETFCVGRSFWEMPGITARICGICPISHILASSKAGDAILGVRVPPTAALLRRMLNWGQLVQSHALSFFHLSGPDLLLGMESDPAARNVMGLIKKYPDVARNGIRLRAIGQEIIRTLGGQSVHPAWSVPGGVREPLSSEGRSHIKRMLPEALDITHIALDMLADVAAGMEVEQHVYGDFPSLYVGLVTPDGGLEHYDGLLRVVDSEGNILQQGYPPERFRDIIGEAVEEWTYLKFPYYKPAAKAAALAGDGAPAYEAGMYRVGPLARVNVCDFAGTPRADAELRRFRRLAPRGKPVQSSFAFHWARLIEILFSLEKLSEAVENPDVTSERVRAKADVNSLVGVGVSEAPRGTLYHEYKVNEDGILQAVNLLVATGQNNLAMNRTVAQIAKHYVKGPTLEEGILNRIEHGIRLYDPCLSCSTHAYGQMALHVQLYGPDGALLDEVRR